MTAEQEKDLLATLKSIEKQLATIAGAARTLADRATLPPTPPR